jgi:hypothetical protein
VRRCLRAGGLTLARADRIREMNAAAAAKRDAANPGSKEHAEALVAMEVYKELSRAVGASL